MSEKLFNQIVKTARSTSASVSKKAEEVFETTKLKVSIADMQNEVESIYTDIGKLVYKAFVENEAPSEEINDKCSQISDILVQIEEVKDKIKASKNLTVCPNCNAAVDANSKFCAACGTKLG